MVRMMTETKEGPLSYTRIQLHWSSTIQKYNGKHPSLYKEYPFHTFQLKTSLHTLLNPRTIRFHRTTECKRQVSSPLVSYHLQF